MLRRQYDFHIYLQYRNETPALLENDEDNGIRTVDIINAVKKYELTAGPDNPIRYVEMELDRAVVVDKFPTIISSIVEGETRLIIDAVDSGTFIITKIWLDGQTYEIIAQGSESLITGTLLTVGMENILASGVAREVHTIWEYSADWNYDYDPGIKFTCSDEEFGTNPFTINNNMPSSYALQLSALADDAFVFFANIPLYSRLLCAYTDGMEIAVGDSYRFSMTYTSYSTGDKVTMKIPYVVESIDADKRQCKLTCTEDNYYSDLSQTIRDYIKEYHGLSVYLYNTADDSKAEEERRKVEYISTDRYSQYNDCMYYGRYKDIQPISPDEHNPDRSGQINLYTSLDDYNRRYSDFDRLMFEKVSGISHQSADAASTVTNRQSMMYYDTATHEEEGKAVVNGLTNIDNTNGTYSTDGKGETINPYYTGGIPSIEQYGVREGTYIATAYVKYNSLAPGVNPAQNIVNNIVRRYRDPPQSISFTLKESKMDDFGYIGWERAFEPFSYATSINDDIHGIYLTNAHRCDGVEDKSLLRLSLYKRHYPEMTTTYTFGGTRESGLSQMIADINQRTV